ncbi:transcriptional corepressor LEUNIG [Trifolium repens]|nr:transcriptional corepressor LEUNIG [Trifolium repens]
MLLILVLVLEQADFDQHGNLYGFLYVLWTTFSDNCITLGNRYQDSCHTFTQFSGPKYWCYTGNYLSNTSRRFQPQSTIFATSSDAITVKLWNAERVERSVFDFVVHNGTVRSLDFHPSEGTLCSSDIHDEIKVWDLNRRIMINEFKGLEMLVIQFGGLHIYHVSSTPTIGLAACKQNELIAAINRDSEKLHLSTILEVRFQSGSNKFATCSTDKTVKLWDANTPASPLYEFRHNGTVRSLDFDSSGRILCSSDTHDEPKVWDVSRQVMIRCLKGGGSLVRFQPGSWDFLAVAKQNVITIIDWHALRVVNSLQGHVKDINSICWDVTGKRIASTSEDDVRVWSVFNGGECIHEYRSDWKKLQSVIFHPRYHSVLVIGGYQVTLPSTSIMNVVSLICVKEVTLRLSHS